MRVTYDKQADAAYLSLQRGRQPRHVVHTEPGMGSALDVNLDFDADRHLIGVEVLEASRRLPPDFLRGARRIDRRGRPHGDAPTPQVQSGPQASLDEASSLGKLWGSILRGVEVDLLSRRAELSVEVVGSAGSTLHRLTLTGVSDIDFSSQIDWDYVEITEATLRGLNDGRRHLHLLLWTEESTLDVVCKEAMLDDGVLAPSG